MFTYFCQQQYLDEYPKLFLVGVDNVGSKQMQQIRQSLRGRAEVLMGKNTMIRKAIRGHLDNNPALEKWESLNAKFVTKKELSKASMQLPRSGAYPKEKKEFFWWV